MGSVDYRKDLPFFLEMYIRGRLKLDELISNRIALEQINEGYEAIAATGLLPVGYHLYIELRGTHGHDPLDKRKIHSIKRRQSGPSLRLMDNVSAVWRSGRS